jgi:hypothetical protein
MMNGGFGAKHAKQLSDLLLIFHEAGDVPLDELFKMACYNKTAHNPDKEHFNFKKVTIFSNREGIAKNLFDSFDVLGAELDTKMENMEASY